MSDKFFFFLYFIYQKQEWISLNFVYTLPDATPPPPPPPEINFSYGGKGTLLVRNIHFAVHAVQLDNSLRISP